jgi:hypothetical protein
MPFALSQKVISSTVGLRYTVDGWFYRQPDETKEVLSNLRARSRQRPLLVVGNGPSLNRTPLDHFAHCPSIGMNKIDLIYPKTAWRPSAIVCVNNLVVRQHRRAFAQSEIPVLMAWKCRWFMRGVAAKNVHYFKNAATDRFSVDASSWVGSLSSTVAYAALQFAYYLEGDPVILMGLDHRFDSNPHQNGIARFTGEDANHFDSNYFQDGQYWGLPDLEGNERSYRIARGAFEAAGRTVLDATVDGALNVFEKIDIAEARSLASK